MCVSGCVYAYARTHVHTCTCTLARAHSRTHTLTHTLSLTHAHSHSRTYTHIPTRHVIVVPILRAWAGFARLGGSASRLALFSALLSSTHRFVQHFDMLCTALSSSLPHQRSVLLSPFSPALCSVKHSVLFNTPAALDKINIKMDNANDRFCIYVSVNMTW
jgi:hypothetical protein